MLALAAIFASGPTITVGVNSVSDDGRLLQKKLPPSRRATFAFFRSKRGPCPQPSVHAGRMTHFAAGSFRAGQCVSRSPRKLDHLEGGALRRGDSRDFDQSIAFQNCADRVGQGLSPCVFITPPKKANDRSRASKRSQKIIKRRFARRPAFFQACVQPNPLVRILANDSFGDLRENAAYFSKNVALCVAGYESTPAAAARSLVDISAAIRPTRAVSPAPRRLRCAAPLALCRWWCKPARPKKKSTNTAFFAQGCFDRQGFRSCLRPSGSSAWPARTHS